MEITIQPKKLDLSSIEREKDFLIKIGTRMRTRIIKISTKK